MMVGMASGIPFDKVQKRRIANMIEQGSTIAHAAKAIGFTPTTVNRHLREDPEFAQMIADAIQSGDGEIQAKLRSTILEEESISGMFRWLERRQPAEWGERKLVVNQHVGPGGGPVQVAMATTDQLRELLSDPEHRDKMLDTIRQLPMIEATASESDD